jgi:hypothetical protein
MRVHKSGRKGGVAGRNLRIVRDGDVTSGNGNDIAFDNNDTPLGTSVFDFRRRDAPP